MEALNSAAPVKPGSADDLSRRLPSARRAAARPYLDAATADEARVGGTSSVSILHRRTATRILSGGGDHHPYVQARLAEEAAA